MLREDPQQKVPMIHSKPTTTDTVVVSDVHLGKIKKTGGLWKKYNEARYAPDSALLKLFSKLTENHQDRLFEFVFNGDTFDFDNVHLPKLKLKEKFAKQIAWQRLSTTKEVSVQKIRIIMDEHQGLFQGLAKLLAQGHAMVFVKGNHDMELTWPEVCEEIRNALLALAKPFIEHNKHNATKERPSVGALASRIHFREWFHYKRDHYYLEHGSQYDPYTVVKNILYPFTFMNSIELSYGSLTARLIASRLGFFNPHVEDQFILSGWGYIRHYWKYHRPYKKDLVTPWIIGSMQSMKALVKIPHYLMLSQRMKHEEERNALAEKMGIDSAALERIEELTPSPVVQKKSQLISLLRFDRMFLIVILSISILILFFLEHILLYPYYWQVIAIIATLDLAAILWMAFGKHHTGARPYIQSANAIARLLNVPVVVFGHTHDVGVRELEHGARYLNPGTWAPAFYDVECTKPIEGWRSFVWIHDRAAKLFQWHDIEERWTELHGTPTRHTEQVKAYG